MSSAHILFWSMEMKTMLNGFNVTNVRNGANSRPTLAPMNYQMYGIVRWIHGTQILPVVRLSKTRQMLIIRKSEPRNGNSVNCMRGNIHIARWFLELGLENTTDPYRNEPVLLNLCSSRLLLMKTKLIRWPNIPNQAHSYPKFRTFTGWRRWKQCCDDNQKGSGDP